MEIRDRIKELRRVKASTLLKNPKNFRKHPKKQKRLLTQLLGQLGYADALIARETPQGLELLDGHLRVDTTPTAIVPVLIVDLNDDEAKLFLATLDPLAAMAETDTAKFSELIDGSPAAGEVKDWLTGIAGPPPTVPEELDDEDQADPVPPNPVSKPGEVYQLGPHRLYCGDSCDPQSWSQLLEGEQLDIVWTDPPYGVSYEGKSEKLRKKRGSTEVPNDTLGAGGLRELLGKSLGNASKVCVPGASWYVAAPAGPPHQVFCEVLLDLQLWKQSLVWVKSMFALSRLDYHYRHEAIFYGNVPGGQRHWCGRRDQDSVLSFPKPTANTIHPTMKPVGLIARCLLSSSEKGALVGDPFGGSGSTLIAAASQGRRARLIELDPGYCDVIRKRWGSYARRNKIESGAGVL
jgi:DNA modification methylase